MTECARGTDDPRCDDGFVLRCGEAGAWQRAAARCELGCEGGACVESPTGDAGPQPSCGSDGEECDDGQYCTVGDTCDEGVCNGTPRGCDDGVACTLGDACDEERDQCVLGTADCPSGEVCDAISGECSANCSGCVFASICYPNGTVNPLEPCERCDVSLSVDGFSAAPSSVTCDDGVACTENDRCGEGSCAGTPLSCAENQRCVESTGSCVGAYALQIGVARVAVTQGSSAGVALTLVRGDDHELPVEVTLLGLPPGVSADALALSGTEDFATLTLRVDARAAEGVSTGLTVSTSDGISVVTGELELFVRGEPGSVDLSFGEGGTSRAAPPGSPGFQGTRVLVDGSDRILVAATSRFVLDPLEVPARASLTRFAAGGALDTTFGDGGTYLETPGSPNLGQGPLTFLGDVALAPDGYVIAGPLGEGLPQEASYLTRLDAAGNRASGFTAPTLGGGLRLIGVAVENGTIFAAGENLSNVSLYRSDLSGANGQRFTDFSIFGSLRSVFWSPADNDFVLAGNCDSDACFAHFNPSSDPPRLFIEPVTNVTAGNSTIVDATADAQGRYFAVTNGWNLVRFLPEPIRPPGGAAFTVVVDALSSVGRQPQGLERAGERLYVAAALPDAASETGVPALVRFSSTWARDSSFGSGGLSQLDGAVEVGSTVDVAVQSDGRIIVATVDAGELVVYRVWD